MTRKCPRTGERGNVLFFILIGVALLGALTMVMSRGGSSVEQTGSYEQNTIKMSRIMKFVKGVEAAIQQMNLNGISVNDISFAKSATDAAYINASCDDDTDRSYPECLLFDSRGAGLIYQAPDSSVTADDWVFTGANIVSGVGTTQPDLIAILPNISQSLCDQINIQFPVANYAADSDINFTPFQGSFASTPETLDNVSGEKVGCNAHNNGGTTEPFFYYVLYER